MIAEEDRKQIVELIKLEIQKELPKILGKSLVQLREYFKNNI